MFPYITISLDAASVIYAFFNVELLIPNDVIPQSLYLNV